MGRLMIRNAWTNTVIGQDNRALIILKVTKGMIRNRSTAHRAVNALRKKLPIERIGLDVVVMDGEPTETPALFGTSSEAEAYVQRTMPMPRYCNI